MSNLKDALHIPDTQSARDERQLAIQRVGVRGVRYPLELRIGATRARRPSPSGISTSRCRPSRRARTCRASSPGSMRMDEPLDAAALRTRARARCSRCSTPTEGRIEARFPFFLRKRAPVSGVESLLEYQGRLIGETRAGGDARSGSRSRCR